MTSSTDVAAVPTRAGASAAAEASGFRFADDGDRLRNRWGRTRWYWIGAVSLILLVAAPIMAAKPQDTVPLSTNNTGTLGARAVAEILRDHGIGVRQIAKLSQARIRTPSETTLVVTYPEQLAAYQVESILKYPGDVTFLGVSSTVLSTLDVGLSTVHDTPYLTRDHGCDSPHAVAAEAIEWGGQGISRSDVSNATVCFLSKSGAGGWATVEQNGRTVTIIADPSVPANGQLAGNGNAALVLRSVGAHPQVVWYAPDYFDTSTLTWTAPATPGDKPSSNNAGTGTDTPPPSEVSAQADFLPRGTGNVIFALVLAVFVAAVWLGRRMGPIVSEPLPVVVHASEATRGRGRLYRRARALGRASSALRASSARRIGSRLGVPRGADAGALLAAVSRATGRSRESIEHFLYGPPPATDEAMMVLVQQLDTLESEVRRP